MNVKINNKNYVVPQLKFEHMTQMEDMGFSVMEMLDRQKIFTMATAFVGVVAGCNRYEAENLIEQHILGGGDIVSIFSAFDKAMEQSAFFKKLLESLKEKQAEEKKTNTTKKSTETK